MAALRSRLCQDPTVHYVHEDRLLSPRVLERDHGPVAGYPRQESGAVVEGEVLAVVLDLGAPVEYQLGAAYGVEPERDPVFARVAEARRVPFYMLGDTVVRSQDHRPKPLDVLLQRVFEVFHEPAHSVRSVRQTVPLSILKPGPL